ncbi:hypothetical protein VM1G_11220 [Cytospora mali]|uniref:Protein kinase domain-containing protein n=1 Tax=Cytospora mali TaxID=578113 RepID=A0A194VJV4_CYTMA|nr:hypothetical protein VM1G_11220 [Valsa mali]
MDLSCILNHFEPSSVADSAPSSGADDDVIAYMLSPGSPCKPCIVLRASKLPRSYKGFTFGTSRRSSCRIPGKRIRDFHFAIIPSAKDMLQLTDIGGTTVTYDGWETHSCFHRVIAGEHVVSKLAIKIILPNVSFEFVVPYDPPSHERYLKNLSTFYNSMMLKARSLVTIPHKLGSVFLDTATVASSLETQERPSGRQDGAESVFRISRIFRDHLNIINVTSYNGSIVVLEHLPLGQLAGVLDQVGERDRLQAVEQLTRALEFLHRHDITHSAISLESIYIRQLKPFTVVLGGITGVVAHQDDTGRGSRHKAEDIKDLGTVIQDLLGVLEPTNRLELLTESMQQADPNQRPTASKCVLVVIAKVMGVELEASRRGKSVPGPETRWKTGQPKKYARLQPRSQERLARLSMGCP